MIRVKFYTLTETPASEHIYLRSLRDAFRDQNAATETNWQDADLIHLFEVNFYTTASLRAFRYPTLVRMLSSDTPVVVSTDDLYFSGDPGVTARPKLYALNQRTQRWLFDNADAVIAISESVHENLTPDVNRQKVHIVKHGVDDRYRVNAVPSKEPFLLHVSLASKRKNPEAILEVAERLDERFVLAGSVWPDIVPRKPAYDNVETPGFVPEDDLIDLYKRASVFYFPTLHEGFGLPVLEAMAAGCAVVTSNVYSVPEVTGGAAILCDPYDVDNHVREIERLLADFDARQALAERAIERSKKFSWRKTAEETIDVYRSVLEEKQ